MENSSVIDVFAITRLKLDGRQGHSETPCVSRKVADIIDLCMCVINDSSFGKNDRIIDILP